MFYENHTTLEIVGQLLLASLFAITVSLNATTKVKQHADRMGQLGVPSPYVFLWAGFAIQAAGAVMVVLDWHTSIGAVLLIIFTVLATAVFHRFWQLDDPMKRHMDMSIFLTNTAVVGGLLLLIAR